MNQGTKKTKVLHIMSAFGGGISSFVRNLATEINTEKISFDVLSFTDYSEEFKNEISNTGGKTLTMPKPKRIGYFRYIKETKKIIQNNGPYDVIECHLTGVYALFFKWLTKDSGAEKFVVHAHTTNDGLKPTLGVKLVRKMNQFLSVKSASQLTSCSILASNFMFGEKEKLDKGITHIPNSILIDKYTIEFDNKKIKKIKQVNDIPLDRLVIGNIARFDTPKNHPFMIKLIEHMSKKNIDFVWLFIGAGESEKEQGILNNIKDMVDEKNLTKYVRFLGRREDANELYQLLDVFVLPSFYEGLPTVIVEAQAAGVPSVISDTITTEVDVNLGMVHYLSLDEEMAKWEETILTASKQLIPSVDQRIDQIEAFGFTNDAAARLYEAFLEGRVISHNIGDNIPQ